MTNKVNNVNRTNLQKQDLLIHACLMYYEEHMNQNEIAKKLSVSRSYISQLLSYAIENKIVKIEVVLDESDHRLIRKEMEWGRRWPKLKQIFILNSDSPDFSKSQMGKFAALFVSDLISKSSVIGVGVGTTIMSTIASIQPQDILDGAQKKIIQIMGGLSNLAIAGSQSGELIQSLSSKIGAEYYYLHCPAVIEDTNVRDSIIKDPTIKNCMDWWPKIDTIIMGIGPADRRSTLISSLSPSIVEYIEKAGLCGELNINYFDGNGRYSPILEKNRIGMSLEEMEKVKNKVVIGFGENKAMSLLGALRGDMIDILITDSITVTCIENLLNSK